MMLTAFLVLSPSQDDWAFHGFVGYSLLDVSGKSQVLNLETKLYISRQGTARCGQ
jgi:hypothetical protein